MPTVHLHFLLIPRKQLDWMFIYHGKPSNIAAKEMFRNKKKPLRSVLRMIMIQIQKMKFLLECF